ncbi:uncharacterized protein LOC124662971 [Lolium rigidum]|uniref:uncharacterized protein LOC124662971 n=1 Tax=Lolium rigidum TaxID=89674 RepID=UPI001F5D91E5|nr:uncharacterized protein LOC124662971 [Lolium rigidum]
MGLEVAEISELAALRPIQTTAVRGALATAAAADDHDAATAADTGCVTPTARATAGEAKDDAAGDGIGCATPTASELEEAPQRDGGADDASCYATPMACRTTMPLDVCEFDAVAAAGDAAAAVNFTTPTSDESALRPATVCPPAPRKLPPALKRKLAPLQQRLFYPVPLDLASVFKPAPPAPAPPAAKKMRAHVVESSLPLGT